MAQVSWTIDSSSSRLAASRAARIAAVSRRSAGVTWFSVPPSPPGGSQRRGPQRLTSPPGSSQRRGPQHIPPRVPAHANRSADGDERALQVLVHSLLGHPERTTHPNGLKLSGMNEPVNGHLGYPHDPGHFRDGQEPHIAERRCHLCCHGLPLPRAVCTCPTQRTSHARLQRKSCTEKGNPDDLGHSCNDQTRQSVASRQSAYPGLASPQPALSCRFATAAGADQPAASSRPRSRAASIAARNAARTPCRSSSRIALIVVPPGEVTASRRITGCSPESRSMVAAP